MVSHPFGNGLYITYIIYIYVILYMVILGDGLWHCFTHITLWLFNIAMENGP